MTKEKEKKIGKERQLLEAARLGQLKQLESILSYFQQSSSKRRANPLASLRKCTPGPGSARDPVTGFTCLHHAALNGHAECVALIIECGACNLNAVDYKGSSALHLASWAGNLQVVRIILGYRRAANEPAAGADNKPPGQREQRHDTLDIDLRNNDKQTPLSLAAQFGHNDVVAELLAHGANSRLRNSQLESPLDLACSNGRLETARLLLDACDELAGQLGRSLALLQPDEIGDGQLASVGACAPVARPASAQLTTGQQQQQPAQQKRSQWSALLRGSTGGSNGGSNKTSSPQSSPVRAWFSASVSQASAAEPLAASGDSRRASLLAELGSTGSATARRLLDHSPLHLAVRRNHVHLVKLLLGGYKANLMQLTGMGSVLHELAIASSRSTVGGEASNKLHLLEQNCMHMMQLFWTHCFTQLGSSSLEQAQLRWREFLSLKNGCQMNVFDVLSELNTRQAHEVRRLIVEFSESRLCQPHEQLNANANRDLLFSNSRQINSFVTMKRVPKGQQQRHAQENVPPSADLVAQRTSPKVPAAFGPQVRDSSQLGQTQTIDRRSLMVGRQSNEHTAQVWHSQQPFGANEAPPAPPQHQLTRSVSNLIQQPFQLSSFELQQQQQMQKLFSDFQWQSKPVPTVQHRVAQPPPIDAQSSKRRRSKSRDLGSVLDEAQCWSQLEAQPCKPSGTGSAAFYEQSVQSQLVRSQTDCSHLMSRFCDESNNEGAPLRQQNTMRGDKILAQSSEQNAQRTNFAPNHNTPSVQQAHQTCTLDRRAINRHYHVYEHEFYPPRLLNQQQLLNQRHGSTASDIDAAAASAACLPNSRQKQAVAIVQPLQAGGSLRNPKSPVEQHLQQQHQQQQRHDSRLSLNIEPLVSSSSSLAANCEKASAERQSFARRSMHTPQRDEASKRLQTNSMHASQSLESRLAGSASSASTDYSFEHTRQNLMRDIDQMIGRELLSGAPQRPTSTMHTSSSSQSSILTGVSLDMDTLGEHITVSGTRITLPSPIQTHAAAKRSAQQQSAPQGSSQSPTVDQPHRAPHVVDSPPTRPASLVSAIYDLPGAGRRADGNACKVSPLQAKQQCVSAMASHLKRVHSITEPPSERPPAPPTIGALHNTPLKLEAPAASGAASSGPSLSSSTSSASSSSCASSAANELLATSAHDVAHSGLLQTATGEQMHADNAPAGAPSEPSVGLAHHHHHHQQQQQHDSIDCSDSGVCTSNSPASMSHDSEGPASCSNGCDEHRRPQASDARETRALDGPRPSTLVVCREGNRCASAYSTAPPSPRTAQICIEQALMPLDNSRTLLAKSDQTTMTYEGVETEERPEPDLGSSVSSWLEASSAPMAGERAERAHRQLKPEADYENCILLQEALKRTAGLQLAAREQNGLESSQLCASDNDDDDDDDDDDEADNYAATSADEDDEENASLSSSSQSGQSAAASVAQLEPHGPASTGDGEHNLRLRKEILVKIVVDENEQSSSGNEVFYLNPVELKKISNKQGTRETETLTDEELCASLDEQSGFIKFTLRKRRCDSNLDLQNRTASSGQQSTSDASTCNLLPTLASCNDIGAGTRQQLAGTPPVTGDSDAARADEQQLQQAPKRTKMLRECNQVTPGQQASAQSLAGYRYNSTESTESGAMDHSQASSSSTSSSSVMSIRSIVSLKNGHKLQEAAKASSAELVDQEQEEALMSPARERASSTAAKQQSGTVEQQQRIESGLAQTHQALGGETARRIAHQTPPTNFVAANSAPGVQATTSQKPPVPPPPAQHAPVAAVRTNRQQQQRIKSNASAEQQALVTMADAQRRVAHDDGPRKGQSIEDEEEKIEPIQKHASVGKRSICWPPRHLNSSKTVNGGKDSLRQDEGENLAPKSGDEHSRCEKPVPEAVDGRVGANRLSFQRMIEEKSQATASIGGSNFATLRSSFEVKLRQQQQLAGVKPFPTNLTKPLPPAKPKNLVAATVSKFNNK